MNRTRPTGAAGILLALACLGPAAAGTKPSKKTPQILPALEWREAGPYRGGRCAAVAGIPGETEVYYFGSTGGGVWKTVDGGKRWKPVSDGFFGGSIGAVAVSEWDPNVVYAGGGEVTVRGNVSHGSGVWKSSDAGRTWEPAGLKDSRHIPRLRIHPRDPDRLYAAVLGHLFAASAMRGIYRSTDGGHTWEQVLFVNDEVGAVDLAMDPTNPRILYATFWRVLRTPSSLASGGPGSGLWKSTDGGDSWVDITTHKGLPRGILGIAGITVSPSNPDNLYAIIEAEEGGVFRSRDAGKTWERTNQDRALRQRAWYYSRIIADPADEESVYVLNVRFHHSKDGGKTFTAIASPHGDHHDLWIAPEDPQRMIEGNDGGANVSFDGGKTWTAQDNQPTAQIYRVSTDRHFPYRILGAQQDNSSLRILHRSSGAGISRRDWEPTAGGESGYVVARPDRPDIVYGGSYGGLLVRRDHATDEVRIINPWPDNPMGWGAADLKYRFQWNFPIFLSPHDPRTLYAAGNILFRTRNEGQSWEAVSPDLTRNDKSKQGPSGGPITKDNTSVEYYGTIFAALESPHEPGVLWTGSDDGLVHLSRDAGATWTDVTPGRLPDWAQINSMEAHPTEAGGLYLAATRYKLDDFHPYLYRTLDYGRTWVRITGGLPEDQFTRVIRADPARPGLLYAGTEEGVHVSFDDGRTWQSLQLDLPVTPITDLAVKDGDLIAATQGRGFWVLDDLSPLRQLTPETYQSDVHLFRPRPAYRIPGRSGETPPGQGTNPPSGVLVYFYLGDAVIDQDVTLEFLQEDGTVMRSFTGEWEKEGTQEEKPRPDQEDEPDGATPKTMPVKAGMNRFAWDMRYPDPHGFPGMVLWAGQDRGPVALPGRYRVRLRAGEQAPEAPFTLLADPRSSSTLEDLRLQFQFLIGVRDRLTEIHDAIASIRRVREQMDEIKKRLGDGPDGQAVRQAIDDLDAKITSVEEALYQTKNQSRQDPLNFPIRLDNKLSALARTVAVGDRRPTDQALRVRDELEAGIAAQMKQLRRAWDQDLPALNRLIHEQGVPAILPDQPEKNPGPASPPRPGSVYHEADLSSR
ncbi:MAG: WD40/YVTN/BNR-like repeat-containing protein [Acidobacteriota bacterium]